MTATLAPPALLGSEVPRLFTPPLRPLTPMTSLGFDAIEFADSVMGMTLLPWQKWFLIHALELKEDRSFRFAVILLLVARQNGKTTALKVIVQWFLYVRLLTADHPGLVLSGAQDLRIAREFWQANVDISEAVPELAAEVANIRYTNGEQCMTLDNGARYMLTATTRGAGRGLSVDCLIIDELREQRTTVAWAALQNTLAARAGSLAFLASNQGDDESVVLNDIRASALAGIDVSLGMFEWSAPDNCDPDSEVAWAQANPALGRTLTIEKLRSIRASSSETDWRTENLCQKVGQLDGAIDADSWRLCGIEGLTLEAVKDQIVGCIDVSVDRDHVTLALAAVKGELIGGEVVAVWSDTDEARRELPDVLRKLHLRALGWYPGGTSGVLGVEIAAAHGWNVGRSKFDGTFYEHSPGVVELAGSDVTTLCMTFADIVTHLKFRHRKSPLLDDHINQTSKYETGEQGAWRFARKGKRPIDASYAMAGAVHLARSLPEYKKPQRSAVY